MKNVKLSPKDRFILDGLDDDCFMVVHEIEIQSDVSYPIIVKGSLYQADAENDTVDCLGHEHIIQLSASVDAIWDDKEGATNE